MARPRSVQTSLGKVPAETSSAMVDRAIDDVCGTLHPLFVGHAGWVRQFVQECLFLSFGVGLFTYEIEALSASTFAIFIRKSTAFGSKWSATAMGVLLEGTEMDQPETIHRRGHILIFLKLASANS